MCWHPSTRLLPRVCVCVCYSACIRASFIQRRLITTHSSCVSHHLSVKLGSQSVLTIFFSPACVCERLCLRENKVKHQAAKNKFPCGLPDACSEAWLFFIPFKHQLRYVVTSGNVMGYSEPLARGLGSSPPLLKCPWARQWTSKSLLYLWKLTGDVDYQDQWFLCSVIHWLRVHVGRFKAGRLVTVSTSQTSCNVTSVSCTQHPHVYQSGWPPFFYYFFIIFIF